MPTKDYLTQDMTDIITGIQKNNYNCPQCGCPIVSAPKLVWDIDFGRKDPFNKNE